MDNYNISNKITNCGVLFFNIIKDRITQCLLCSSTCDSTISFSQQILSLRAVTAL